MEKMIYIIDDDPDILVMLQIFLQKNGFKVTADYNGENLEKQQELSPGVYLVDINLAGKNGMELCKLIKKESSNIPVVLMSGGTDADMLAKDCNADAFVPKPFDMQAVLSTLDRLVA